MASQDAEATHMVYFNTEILHLVGLGTFYPRATSIYFLQERKRRKRREGKGEEESRKEKERK